MAEGPGEQSQSLFRPPMSDPEVDLEHRRGARPKMAGSTNDPNQKGGELKQPPQWSMYLQVRGTDFYLPLVRPAQDLRDENPGELPL